MPPLMFVTAAILSGSALAQEPVPSPSDSKAVISRGIAFVTKEALDWKNERKCVSCHHAGLALWSLREARQHGHSVDDAALAEITSWVAESGEGKTSIARPAGIPKAFNAAAVYLAVALGADSKPDEASRRGLQRLLGTVKADQTAGGFWSAWPETRQPIFGVTDEVVTAFATLAVLPVAESGDSAAKAALDKGIRSLSESKAGNDAQAVALRLILWRRAGRPAAEWRPLQRAIEARQNADGGWSQADPMASDAWATGQALYALATAGAKPTDPHLVRGRAFLAKTQRADGSWAMTSRPVKPGGAGSKDLSPITCAGSAWAILGLVRSDS